MITMDEDVALLRTLVFNGMEIDKSFVTPILAMKSESVGYSLDYETGCPHCGKPFKPFGIADNVTLVRTACDKHYKDIFANKREDVILAEARKLIVARVIQQKFDEFCQQYPWLIQESFAYNRCLLDWLAMYEKLKQEKEAVERELADVKAGRDAVERKETGWFRRWFVR